MCNNGTFTTAQRETEFLNQEDARHDEIREDAQRGVSHPNSLFSKTSNILTISVQHYQYKQY